MVGFPNFFFFKKRREKNALLAQWEEEDWSSIDSLDQSTFKSYVSSSTVNYHQYAVTLRKEGMKASLECMEDGDEKTLEGEWTTTTAEGHVVINLKFEGAALSFVMCQMPILLLHSVVAEPSVFPSGLLYDMVWARACKQCSGFYRVTECALPVCDCSTAALKHELVGAVLEGGGGGGVIPEDHAVMQNVRSATVLAITHLFDGSSELGELDAVMEMRIRQLKMRLGIIKDE
jgi:hypothetical protein